MAKLAQFYKYNLLDGKYNEKDEHEENIVQYKDIQYFSYSIDIL